MGNEKDMVQILKDRTDFCYLCDVGVKDEQAFKEAVGDKFMKRFVLTKKKMGAQTLEAHGNAGVAAANQIVNFFEVGDVRFQVKDSGTFEGKQCSMHEGVELILARANCPRVVFFLCARETKTAVSPQYEPFFKQC